MGFDSGSEDESASVLLGKQTRGVVRVEDANEGETVLRVELTLFWSNRF